MMLYHIIYLIRCYPIGAYLSRFALSVCISVSCGISIGIGISMSIIVCSSIMIGFDIGVMVDEKDD